MGGGGFSYVRGGPSASQSQRNAGANANSLSATNAVLGATITLTVDLTTTGHAFAALYLFADPANLTLGGGQVVLVGGPLICAFAPTGGPSAVFNAAVPNDLSLLGVTYSAQAVHFLGVQPFALSNALDLTGGF